MFRVFLLNGVMQKTLYKYAYVIVMYGVSLRFSNTSDLET